MSPPIFTVLASLALAFWGSGLCEPSAEVTREVEQAASGVPEQGPAEHLIHSLRSLPDRLPGDLFVHLAYQDAVKQRGVEGHLKEMFEDYLMLRTQHPEDLLYLYLYGRALQGRTTSQAIMTMGEVLQRKPDYAPAHRTLAEIYGSPRFRDRQKEATERSKFLEACPGSVIAKQPPALPPRGDFAGAEQLLGKPEGKDRVAELVYQAFVQNEWRQQRMRPFDWYTVDEKKQAAVEAKLAQWHGWALLVRHYRALQQDEKSRQLLAEMQERFERIQGDRSADLYWTAATALVQLYAEDKGMDKAAEILKQMETVAREKPNRTRSAELARLKSSLLGTAGRKPAKSAPARGN